jgi:hypothetical protein
MRTSDEDRARLHELVEGSNQLVTEAADEHAVAG